MQQPLLFDASICTHHTVQGNNMTAVFEEKWEGAYEVVLTVSSHKFLVHVKPGTYDLDEFEIVTMRGFIDYNISLMHTVKKIVSHMCYGSAAPISIAK